MLTQFHPNEPTFLQKFQAVSRICDCIVHVVTVFLKFAAYVIVLFDGRLIRYSDIRSLYISFMQLLL